jgi:hypothetical protein
MRARTQALKRNIPSSSTVSAARIRSGGGAQGCARVCSIAGRTPPPTRTIVEAARWAVPVHGRHVVSIGAAGRSGRSPPSGSLGACTMAAARRSSRLPCRRATQPAPFRRARDHLAGQLPAPNCSHDKLSISCCSCRYPASLNGRFTSGEQLTILPYVPVLELLTFACKIETGGRPARAKKFVPDYASADVVKIGGGRGMSFANQGK